jgi:hypothetical protein
LTKEGKINAKKVKKGKSFPNKERESEKNSKKAKKF